MRPIPTLDTPRLRLRELTAEDVPVFTRIYADPEVARHLGDGAVMDAAQAWRACAALLGHWGLRGYGQWVVEEKASGTAMGRCGIYHPEGWPGIEVGWTLGREHWGNGYATEAGAAALRYAFEVVGATHVISLIRPANTPSIRVAEKLGGVLEDRIDLLGAQALVYGYAAPPPPPAAPSTTA